MADLSPDAGPAADVTTDIGSDVDSGDAVAETTTEQAEATTEEPDLFDTDADMFPRHYVEKTRKESAGYRTKLRETEERLARYSGAFDGYDDDLQSTFLALPKALREDPAGTAQWMKEQAEAILAEHEQANGNGTQQAEGDDDRPLTKAEVEKLFAEREAKSRAEAEQKQLVESIYAEAKELGYENDPKNPDFMRLLWTAQTLTNGDLKAAHEQIEADKQKIVDEFVKSKKTEARRHTEPTPQAGGPGATEEVPKTWEAARKAAEARIEALGAFKR